jgi:tRNA A37 threonylcarbamoyladenosine synthetase subunit TsaC/SUA5/YrdC
LSSLTLTLVSEELEMTAALRIEVFFGQEALAGEFWPGGLSVVLPVTTT